MTKQEKNRFKELKRKVEDGGLTLEETRELTTLYSKSSVKIMLIGLGIQIGFLIFQLIRLFNIIS